MSEVLVEDSQALQQTALLQEHRAAGARIVPFAGWEMPVQYSGVIDEVRAVRDSCGLFDVSHMGHFFVAGEGTTEALDKIVSADWQTVPIGRVAYALLLNENGGVIDDIMGYRLWEDEWLIVVNASRAAIDEAHLRQHLPPAISLKNSYDNQAMLAIQGPKAESMLQKLSDESIADIQWRDVRYAIVGGASGILARGGYTGCDGFEFMFKADDAPHIWRALIEAGAAPCGLGARDVLRLEAGLPLYGHELREEWTPGESGCGFAAKLDKPAFMGRAALLENPTPLHRIRALKMMGRAIPREGYAVLKDGTTIGEITSGTLSPTLGSGIALAFLPADLPIGETVEIQIRNATHTAEIVKPPFVAHGRK
ncbi:MAG TPA: glycine cleavage system aminomethyltransferase GcvT [Abditibacteriaceae bacterium]|jgi:aminomethyltransferase